MPGLTREILPGELVWVRRPTLHAEERRLELLRDGQVVFNEEYAFSRLSDVVAAHPPALEHATRAEAEMRSSERKAIVALGMLGATVASIGVGIAGLVKHDIRLASGGIGGTALFFSLSLGFVASADHSGKITETESMNAVDRYNDDYL